MQIKDSLASLLKVKTLVTMVVITVFAVLSFTGRITPDNVMIIVSSVISFYFGTQHEKTVENGVSEKQTQQDTK